MKDLRVLYSFGDFTTCMIAKRGKSVFESSSRSSTGYFTCCLHSISSLFGGSAVAVTSSPSRQRATFFGLRQGHIDRLQRLVEDVRPRPFNPFVSIHFFTETDISWRQEISRQFQEFNIRKVGDSDQTDNPSSSQNDGSDQAQLFGELFGLRFRTQDWKFVLEQLQSFINEDPCSREDYRHWVVDSIKALSLRYESLVAEAETLQS
ncbi:hypothetical protein B0T17DRAFT_511885 [Bombardia bombarda]|uniref:Uncharacterized protein n=1 Tax=Bombardia bombarda TaxID=252184 RepID=A0AA39TGS9_9PEZI|nr:hypothetical protein B0T17DRAFT_511885 [Bombardia bombarda]